MNIPSSQFDKQRDSCLSAIDLSRKGSVDSPILDLVKFINHLQNYFTTSSCSGRIMVFENDSVEEGLIQKKGCKWLYTTHEQAMTQCVIECLQGSSGNAVFKFEPFVLHVQCRCLEDAQKLHSVAVSSGFRNSGITVGTKGKIIAAVRSTHSLEVPLSNKGKVLVSDEYVDFIVNCANEKLDENFKRIERFFSSLREMIDAPNSLDQKALKKQKKKELKQEQDRIKNNSKNIVTSNKDDEDEEREGDLNFFCFDET